VAGLYSTKKTIAEAGKLTASDKTIRTAHATQRATIALQLKVINTELVNNPQADTAVLYAQQRALYEALHAENTAHQGYLLAFAQQRATQIANAKLQNNAVAPTVAVYEANEKTINEVMLNTVEVGVYSFTNVEKQLINNIANTCPIIAGPACYRARCLRSVYEPNIDYNDVDLCQQVGIAFRKPRSSVKEEVKYTVFPNPTNNTLAIQRSQGNVESESLLLTDVLGRIILKKVLIGIDNSIDVNTIPSGIYYLKIESTEQLDYIQKISIIH
jgi:hypothetical protein